MHKTNLSLARAKTLLSGLVISQLGLGRAVLDDASSHVLESSFLNFQRPTLSVIFFLHRDHNIGEMYCAPSYIVLWETVMHEVLLNVCPLFLPSIFSLRANLFFSGEIRHTSPLLVTHQLDSFLNLKICV